MPVVTSSVNSIFVEGRLFGSRMAMAHQYLLAYASPYDLFISFPVIVSMCYNTALQLTATRSISIDENRIYYNNHLIIIIEWRVFPVSIYSL